MQRQGRVDCTASKTVAMAMESWGEEQGIMMLNSSGGERDDAEARRGETREEVQ